MLSIGNTILSRWDQLINVIVYIYQGSPPLNGKFCNLIFPYFSPQKTQHYWLFQFQIFLRKV